MCGQLEIAVFPCTIGRMKIDGTRRQRALSGVPCSIGIGMAVAGGSAGLHDADWWTVGPLRRVVLVNTKGKAEG